MAISNTNLLRTKKPFSLPLLPFMTFFLMLLYKANSSNTTDFEFNNFNPNQTDLILQGDAEISATNTLQLTKTNSSGNPQKNSVGRALYYTPVHLWDTTGRVASFETSFTFVISSPTREIAGDGLTIFFAPPETTIPSDSDGGFLGLFSNNTLSHNIFAVNNSSDQILAVEFDTYINGKWDPNYRHIGINVNTIRSRAEIKWERKNGSIATATVSYNTNNKKLYVVSSYSDSEEYVFSSSIDLQTVLPEWVRVGFSASTGDNEVETHNILSWSFSSWLHNVTVAKEEDMYIARYL